jgi:hypothetical protein
MARQDLIELIKNSIEQGTDRERLVSDLIFAGFSYQEIQGALNQMASAGQLPTGFFSGVSKRMQRTPQGQHIETIVEATKNGEVEQETVGEIIKKYKKRFFIIVGLVIVIFGGISFGLYLYGTNSSVIVGKALANFSQARTFGYYLKSNVDVAATPGDNFYNNLSGTKATLESRGIIDLSGSDYAKFSSQILLHDGYDSTSTPVWDLSLISLDPSDTYLKLNSITTSTLETKALNNQLELGWVKIDDSLDNLKGTLPERMITQLPYYQRLMTSALVAEILKSQDKTLIKEIKSLGVDTIRQADYYHFQITFMTDGLQGIFSQFHGSLGINGGELNVLAQVPWDVWISKSDPNIFRIKISPPSASEGAAFEPKDIDVYLSGFNSIISVIAPQQFGSLKHILEIIKQ